MIEEEQLVARANVIGAAMKARLESPRPPQRHHADLGDPGPGAMVGFDIVKARGSDEPDPDATKQVQAKARELGLILLTGGMFANTIRLLVPLTVSDEVLAEGLDLLERALTRK